MNESANASSVNEPINEELRVFILIFGTGVLASGLLGNVLLLAVMFSHRKSKKFRYVFITNLAIADLLVTACALPYFLLDLLLGRSPVLSDLHCSLNALLLCISYSVSILSLVLISLQRYVKVCHRRLFCKAFTVRREIRVCLAVWFFAGLGSAPVFGMDDAYDSRSHTCNPRGASQGPNYGSFFMISILLVPTLMISFFNAAIFRRWNNSRRKLQKRKKNVKVAKSTWQSFLSKSLDDITSTAFEETDIQDECTNAGLSIPRLRSSQCLSNLTSSAAEAAAASDGDINIRKPARKSEVRFSMQRKSIYWGLSENFDPEMTTPDISYQGGQLLSTSVRHRPKPVSSNIAGNKTVSDGFSIEVTNDADDEQNSEEPEHCVNTTPDSGASNTAVRGILCPRQGPKTCKGTWGGRRKGNRSSFVSHTQELNRPASDSIRYAFNNSTLYNTGADVGSSVYPLASCLAPGDWTNIKDEKDKSCEMLAFSSPAAEGSYHSSRVQGLYPSIDRRGQFLAWRRARLRPGKQLASDLALVRSLLVITVCIILFYTPFFLTLILTIVLKDNLPTEVSVVATLLLFINCAINWIIYGVMNTAFRKAYIAALKQCVNFCRKHHHRSSSCDMFVTSLNSRQQQ